MKILEEARRIAEAATPGEWTKESDGWIENVVQYEGCGSHKAEWLNSNDLKYVCTMNPSFVIRLIEALELAIQQRDEELEDNTWEPGRPLEKMKQGYNAEIQAKLEGAK